MFFFYCIFFIILNEIIFRNNYYLDKIEFSKHKKFVSKKTKVPVTAGFYIFFFLIFFYEKFKTLEIILITMFFLTGIFSDRFKNFSPAFRLFSHILITSIFVFYSGSSITDVRIDIFNDLLNIKIFALIFTIFCFLILVHGTNFIDGVNLNTIFYYLCIYLALYKLSYFDSIIINEDFLLKIALLLFILGILNFFNKTQLGDAGCYILSFFTAFFLINVVKSNYIISPYFIILLLWYPCFENLFSIIRKKYQKKSISDADNFHLHQIIFLNFKKKNYKYENNKTGLSLLFYNITILSISSFFFNDTKLLILLIIINTVTYITMYNILIKKLKFKKSTY